MRDYKAMTDEMLAWARMHKPSEDVPTSVQMGSAAFARLQEIYSGQRPVTPDLIKAPGFYSMLSMSGLPVHVREEWPENLFAVIDGAGRAVIAGVLNPAPVEDDDA